MSKRVLSLEEQFRLRNELQMATLAALMDSRRWEAGDLAFQGGTCLHMSYGSARFSEDLDFMVRGGLPLDGLANEVARRLRLPDDTPADLKVAVTRTPVGRNPHAFTVSLAGPDVIGSAKVKIELWQTNAEQMEGLRIVVSTIRSSSGQQTFVPVITLDEILADKVYALGARDRLKPRDVYDLWWMFEARDEPELRPQALLARLSIYPRGNACETAKWWLGSASGRLEALSAPGTAGAVAVDLSRWLPTSLTVGDVQASRMLAVSADKLRHGLEIVRAFSRSCEGAGAG